MEAEKSSVIGGPAEQALPEIFGRNAGGVVVLDLPLEGIDQIALGGVETARRIGAAIAPGPLDPSDLTS